MERLCRWIVGALRVVANGAPQITSGLHSINEAHLHFHSNSGREHASYLTTLVGISCPLIIAQSAEGLTLGVLPGRRHMCNRFCSFIASVVVNGPTPLFM